MNNLAQTYLVGGAVRDKLLGIAIGDHDYVVVGSTVAAMLQQGFKSVGKDFPVFLHPRTHEEYALARTERKNGNGYTNFTVHASPEVTLIEDLARRDLTINAIAQCQDGTLTLIDPYDGQGDLQRKLFRHVSAAFTEDPLRILRLARFAARYSNFTVAPETMALMRQMVNAGEVSHLVAERTWQELSRGLLEPAPLRMLEVLDECGALAVLLPEIKALQGVPQTAQHHPEIDCYIHIGMVLKRAVELTTTKTISTYTNKTYYKTQQLSVRFAALVHDLGKALTPLDELPRHRGHEGLSLPLIEALCQRLRVPTVCQQLAVLVAAEHGNIHRSNALDATGVLKLFMRCDALRQTERFELALMVCQADAQGRLSFETTPYPQAARLLAALHAAKSVPGGVVITSLKAKILDATGSNISPNNAQIAQAVHSARRAAIAAILKI